MVRPGRLSRAVVREESNIEPVSIHARDMKVYEEFLHSFAIQAMVDGTPGPGHCALACVRRRVPYMGLCLTDDHAALLLKRIVYLVFQEMKREDSPLFEPGLNKALKDIGEEDETEPKKKRPRKIDTPKKPGVVPNPGRKGGEDPPPDSEESDEGEDK